jgi:outer membrane lipoprotein-sorting protein
MKVRGVVLLAAVAAGSLATAQQSLMETLLEKGKEARYAGVRDVSFRRGDKTVTFQERIIRSGSSLRIEHPPGSPFAGQIIVETGSMRRHYLPDQKIIRELPRATASFGRELVDPFNRRSGEWQEAKVSEQVAGRSVRRFEHTGSTLGSVAVEIDSEAGVILAREIKDRQGAVIGSFRFRAIKMNPSLRGSEFRLNIPGVKVVRIHDELKAAAAELGMKPIRIRAGGFELMSVRKIDSEAGKALLVQFMRNTDRVTVVASKKELDGKTLRALVRGRGNLHVWKKDGVSLAIISSLPESSLKWIADRVSA